MTDYEHDEYELSWHYYAIFTVLVLMLIGVAAFGIERPDWLAGVTVGGVLMVYLIVTALLKHDFEEKERMFNEKREDYRYDED